MATNYKILGQASGAAASGTQLLNGWQDPNFEYYASQTEHVGSDGATAVIGNRGVGPLFYVTGGQNDSDHTSQIYHGSDHSPYGTSATGRTKSIRFRSHYGGHNSNWRVRPEVTKPYLTAGKSYTLSLWTKITDDSSGHAHRNLYFDTGNGTYQDVYNFAGSGQAETPRLWGTTTNDGFWHNWKQHYTTFTGTGGFFNLHQRCYSTHSNREVVAWLDNIQLLEGAVPFALLSNRATDGTSGNANALYTSPYTTRSEGWQDTAYLSPTIRRLTGAWQNLYVCPDLTETVLSTITISNIGTAAATYRIAVQKFGETLSHKHMLAFDHAINSNSAETLTLGVTLSQGDKIIVQSDVDKVTFSAYGSEITL
jgi:hypothetical protein